MACKLKPKLSYAYMLCIIQLYSTQSLPVHILLYGHHALDCKMATDQIGIDIHLHDSSVHDKYRYFWSVCMG